jgi:L-ascorbate oxidase
MAMGNFFAKAGLSAALAIACLAISSTVRGDAAELIEPPVFASSDGLLDLVMIATAQPVTNLTFTRSGGGDIRPTGWIYEICRRSAGREDCPAGPGTVASYGGARLALQPGDTLKIHLINRLPAISPAKLSHVNEPGQANLALNPTNLHTHGLLVAARAPSVNDPTFGDYVFVSLFNRANGLPVPQAAHQHGSIVMGAIDYRIEIPGNHPSGLFWFHPHIHGLSLNQVSSGLSGIITIGNVGDYARGDAMGRPLPEASVRHLILKDMQVLAAGTVQFENGPATVAAGEVLHQEDPEFCSAQPASAAELRQGACAGADNSADEGSNFTGGKWYFTVNGQQYPTIRMTDPDGEIWRLTNASGSVSYRLELSNDANHAPMVMQLLAVDGTSVSLPQDTPPGKIVELAGGRFRVVACPPAATVGAHPLPVCVDQIVMMPSARAEVWVTHRNLDNRVTPPRPGATATLKMIGLTMGSGDNWPAVDLAKVEFAQIGPQRLISNNVELIASAANRAADILSAPNPAVAGVANRASTTESCKPLPAGHRRRIFFGFEDVTVENSFALGYEEVDRRGIVVPGTQRPMARFDPGDSIVCLPLGPGQTPVHETWELVQLSTENHNFHIHQSRFETVNGQPRGNEIKARILQDNVPLGVAVPRISSVMNSQNGVCTPDQWRTGQCVSNPVVVDIVFSQIGEFVYHCHILEHEDGGMMAKIRVVAAQN